MRVLRDFQLQGTVFRGLVVDGPYCLCAYIGVPRSHWLADMDALEVDCHWGLTFRGTLASQNLVDYYWFGWDYGHAGDLCTFVGRQHDPVLRQGKRWTADEIEHDIVDVAVDLHAALSRAATLAHAAVDKAATASLDSPPDEDVRANGSRSDLGRGAGGAAGAGPA